MRIKSLMLLTFLLGSSQQVLVALQSDEVQYRQKQNVAVNDNKAKNVMCGPSRDPRIEEIPEKLTAIDKKLSSIKSQISSHDKSTETEFDVLCTLMNSTLKIEEHIEKKLKCCCTTLDSKIDALTDDVENGFDNVQDTLTDIRVQQDKLESQSDRCCKSIDTQINVLTETIEGEFNFVFDALDVIKGIDTTIESKVDSLAAQTVCSPIAITVPTTISLPGHYCLANDLSGVDPLIAIFGSSANDIVLDLNGHVLNVTTFGIAFDGVTSHNNIEIINGSIVGGVFGIAINSSNVKHHNIKLKNISTRGANAVGFFAVNVQGLLIDQCSTFSCGDNLIEGCTDVLIQDSFFNNNTFDGCSIIRSSNIKIINSFFDDNGLSNGSVNNGLSLNTIFSLKAKDCSFSRSNLNSANQKFGVNIDAATASSEGLVFDNCEFNNNILDGVITATGFSDVASFFVTCIAFDTCEAINNGLNGFHVKNNTVGSHFVSCLACGNANYGFLVEGINPTDVSMENSIAKENGIAGFKFASGTGLVQGNKAVDNAICGFDDSLPQINAYSFVANVAKGNGTNPADVHALGTDSNYCLNGAATAFIPTGFGPFPYYQLGLLPGVSRGYWDNITLPQ